MIHSILIYEGLIPAKTIAHIIGATKNDFSFTVAHTIDEFQLEVLKQNAYDLCVVDLLEGPNRFELVNIASKIIDNTPLIVIGKNVTHEDVAEVFTRKADDLIRVPLSIQEFIYRMRAVIRRTAIGKNMFNGEHRIGQHYTFKPKLFTVIYEDPLNGEIDEVKLTPKECYLLQLLCKHKNEVLPRDKAMTSIWGDSNFFIGRSLDVFMVGLRKVFAHDENIKIINVRGVGYKFIDD